MERRRLLLRGFEQACDAADLGRHAGRDDHRPAAAVGGDRAGEQHVAAVAEANIRVDGLRLLRHRHALPGQGCLVSLQVCAFDDAGVGGDLVPGLDQHEVAGNDIVGRDPLALAVADHGGLGRGKGHQCPHRLLGPRLLDIAEQGVQHDDRENDDRLVGQGGLARVLQQPFEHRDGDGDQQDDHQEALELLEQPPPPGRLRRAREPIGPMQVQALLRFGSAQAPRNVRAECCDHGFSRLAVWGRWNVPGGRRWPSRHPLAVSLPARASTRVQHHCLGHGDLRPQQFMAKVLPQRSMRCPDGRRSQSRADDRSARLLPFGG